MRHADDYVSENCALVGDAAHTIHPLAGLGVNLGLMDAAGLMQTLIDGRTHKNPSVIFDYCAIIHVGENQKILVSL